jgi:DNA replication and repair protein RecF
MKIKNIQINNIRNINRLFINLDNKNIVIYGRNAQGKTTILESIYYLVIGKTIRRGRDKNIITKSKTQSIIKGVFENRDKEEVTVEFLLGSESNKKIAKFNNNVSKLNEVIGQVKAVMFTAEDLSLIESPQKRRRFIDILISVLDKSYLRNLLEYKHVIKQRNKLLFHIKQEDAKKEELNFWNSKLSLLGENIIKKRISVIKEMNVLLKESLFFKDRKFFIKYSPIFKTKEDILSALNVNIEKEIIISKTTIGPHRDSILFYVDDFNIDYYGSRGEKRGAIVELKKAEIEIIKKETGEDPILLLDDVLSELDSENKKIILDIAKDEQTIITTANLEDFKNYSKDVIFYEVKDGEIINGTH